MLESAFKGVGGLSIFTRTWRPVETARGVVVISHGFNSHSGQYFWVAEQLTAAGLAVYALDHRGRGKSDGERFFVEKFTDFTEDLAAFIQMAKAENPGLPVFLLGHSAGGVIACGYTIEHQSEIAGLICESFAFKLPVPDLVLAALKGVSYLAPHLHVFALNNKDFSRDPAVVESMNNDPLIKGESQPAETAAEMIRADQMLEKCFPMIKIPVLIIHGTEDHATKPSGSQFFYDTAGSADKTLKLYEGHYHDLLSDVDKEIVMADIQHWIDERIPAETSSGAGA
ncbi:MAG TPA: alpha/beta hydrolase [Pyrinomonadaceae bacterium]|jgi:alpha-beta hydrolase superfamily lysophospholipase|nr:alpha/beta hydrolase [Pyrinomonadaceae bacterium]